MRKPRGHGISLRQRTAGVHRLARLLALLAMLLNQPLAALHAATDEEHLSHGVAHFGHRAGAPHDDAHQGHGGSPHSHDLHHQACQVCPLVGSALAPLGSSTITDASAWHYTTGPAAIQAIETDKRLRVGDPVRAPPPVHLI